MPLKVITTPDCVEMDDNDLRNAIKSYINRETGRKVAPTVSMQKVDPIRIITKDLGYKVLITLAPDDQPQAERVIYRDGINPLAKDASDSQLRVHLNKLTNRRIETLVKDGFDFEDAVTEVQTILHNATGTRRIGKVDSDKLSTAISRFAEYEN